LDRIGRRPARKLNSPSSGYKPFKGRREVLHIRHHTLFAPRDFDLSPWFNVVKPHLADGFDRRRLTWSD
jgi:hypothetical protein